MILLSPARWENSTSRIPSRVSDGESDAVLRTAMPGDDSRGRHCERKRSNPWSGQVSVDCFVAYAPRNDVDTGPRSHSANAPGFFMFPLALQPEGAGKPGARCTRSLACKIKKHTSIVTTVTPDSPDIPRAMVLTSYRVLSPVTGLFVTVASGIASASLTPAPGCQDHTPWPSANAPLVNAASTSTASRPASVTIANRPSVGRDGETIIRKSEAVKRYSVNRNRRAESWS